MFGDATLLGTCAVAYAVIQQPSGIKQGLIASESRKNDNTKTEISGSSDGGKSSRKY